MVYQPLVARKAYWVALAGRILTLGIDAANIHWQRSLQWYVPGSNTIIIAGAGLGICAALLEGYSLLEHNPSFRAHYGKVITYSTLETFALGVYVSGIVIALVIPDEGTQGYGNDYVRPPAGSGWTSVYLASAAIALHAVFWIWDLTSCVRRRRSRWYARKYTQRAVYTSGHAESQAGSVSKERVHVDPSRPVPRAPSAATPTQSLAMSAGPAELPPTDHPPPLSLALPPQGSSLPMQRTERPPRTAAS